MEKEFVSYEQAVALKELGYKEKDYLNYYFKVYKEDAIQLWKGTNKLPDASFPIVPAPLKQQVFRWFREKYNMLANVYSNASGFLFEYHDTIGGTHRYDSDITGPNDAGCWDTYEEAENACIDKLIELAKG